MSAEPLTWVLEGREEGYEPRVSGPVLEPGEEVIVSAAAARMLRGQPLVVTGLAVVKSDGRGEPGSTGAVVTFTTGVGAEQREWSFELLDWVGPLAWTLKTMLPRGDSIESLKETRDSMTQALEILAAEE